MNIRTWAMLGLMSTAALSVHAQEVLREKQVPQEIREDFSLRFSEAEGIVWGKDAQGLYGARFRQKGSSVQATYSEDGKWIQTTEDIPYIAMPDEARAYCKGNYPDYNAQQIHKVSTRKFGILYEIRITGERKQIGMTFDMHGKLLESQEAELEEGSTEEKVTTKQKLQGIFKQ